MIIDPNKNARPKTRVAVCIPCGDQVAAGFAFDLGRMLAAMAKLMPEVELRLFMVKDTNLLRGRTDLVQQALRADCTHVLFLDSDMRFPKHTLARLLSHEEPVVAASYVTRRAPIHAIAFQGDGSPLVTGPESSGLEEAAAVGAGVMLVDADVFRGLPMPWFMFDYNFEAGAYQGEDVFFCLRVREAGLRVLVDHDLSKDIGHLGEWEYRHEHARAYHEAAASVASS